MVRTASLQAPTGRAPAALFSSALARRDAVWRRLLHNQLALAGGLMLAVVVCAALFAPLLSPLDPLEMNPLHLLEPPSTTHWLGTDEFGRDIISRVIWGARISLYVGGIAVTIAVA